MNNNQQTLARLHEIITKAVNGAIVLPSNPSQDAIAAATSLYLGLIKMGKNVSLVCAQSVSSDLTASDKIQSNLVSGGDNLVVSFPYTDGAIDKVDYNIQGENFNLIISPRQGYPKMEPNQVKYSYTGGLLDFIIVVDSPTLNNLGSSYTDNQTQFQGREIINIDRHLTNSFFGTVNFVNKTASSIFENVATLLRMGALKKMSKKPDFGSPMNSFQSPMPQQPTPQPFMQQPKFPQKSQGNPEIQPVKPIETVEKEVKPEPQNPQDWLKPKIFKGSGLI
ncbi:hypothetical protein HY041_00360 [Candidatus Roizmanbacteria bacterium]|nr:hypothetical protein [Candidatus Roizmanbacteria bacterium]